MPTVPVLKPREIVKAFDKLGWEVARVYESAAIRELSSLKKQEEE